MDFKKRLIEKLDLSTIAANTMYSVYIDVCLDVAKEYSAEQNKELIEENEKILQLLSDVINGKIDFKRQTVKGRIEQFIKANLKTHKK